MSNEIVKKETAIEAPKEMTPEELEAAKKEFEAALEEANEATDRIVERGVFQLLVQQPFVGHLVQQLARKKSLQLPTAGVTAIDGKYTLFMNPFFMSELTDAEGVAVLTHEVYHLLNEHLRRWEDLDKKMYNVACLPPGQIILGANKSIEDIQKNEKVISQTGYTNVNNTASYDYNGLIYKIKASGCLEFEVTDEHPVLVHERNGSLNKYPIKLDNESVWKNAKQLEAKRDYVLIPKLKGTTDVTSFDLNEFIHSHGKTTFPYRTKLTEFKLNEESAWILGLYVAEGSKSTAKNNGIDFSLSYLENNLESRIRNFGKNLGYSVRTINKDTRKKVIIQSIILSRAFEKWCGKGAYNKQVPDFILNHRNLNILESFIDGFIEGDGCEIRGGISGASVSKKLILQLQLMYARLNKFASATKSNRNERKINGKTLKPYTIYNVEYRPVKISKRLLDGNSINSFSYRWKDLGEYFAIPIDKIEIYNYNGKVYNLETQDHTFCVNNIITHNSDMAINPFIPNLPSFNVDDAKKKMMESGMNEEEATKALPKPDQNGRACSGMLPANYGMPNDKSAEWYYEKIMSNKELKEKFQQKVIKINLSQGISNMSKAEQDQLKQDIKDGKVQIEVGTDSHDDWEKTEGQTPEVLDEELRRMIRESLEKSRNYGNLPSNMQTAINDLLTTKINWKTRLRSFLQRATHVLRVNSRKRPSRRYGVSFPGQKSDYKLNLGVVIDTSGSIGKEELELFVGEINRIFETKMANITMIFADTEIQKVEKLSKPLKIENFRAYGGGGTDATSWLKKLDELGLDAAVILTDFYFSYDLKQPKCLVLFAITEHGVKLEQAEKELKWARKIQLEIDKK